MFINILIVCRKHKFKAKIFKKKKSWVESFNDLFSSIFFNELGCNGLPTYELANWQDGLIANFPNEKLS